MAEEKNDIDLDNILDDALNDFDEEEKIEEKQPNTNAEEKKEPNEDLGGMGTEESMAKILEMMSESLDGMDGDPDALFDEIFEGMDKDKGGIDGIFEGLMGQILAKEVLYEPFKEIDQMYPKFLEESKEKLSTEEYETYVKQHEIIVKIVKEYEGDNKMDTIIALLNEMQNSGTMPDEIVKKMTNGMPPMPGMPGMGMPGMPGMPDDLDPKNCTIC